MKNLLLIPIVGVVFGFTGCASTPKFTLHETVGPDPSARANTTKGGVLEVYSAFQRTQIDPNYSVFFEGESMLKNLNHLPAHTDYTVYGQDGKVVERVRNSRNLGDDHPTEVTLPPGRYQVEAETEGMDGDVETAFVPVVVEPLKTTAVHLDGNWAPPGHYQSTEVVALPDGRIAGWRAAPAALHAASTASPSANPGTGLPGGANDGGR